MKRKIWRFLFLGSALFFALSYAILALQFQPVAPHPFFAKDKFQVMAHQGGMGLGPENTLFTFARAVALGVDVLDMDLHQTRDGIPVILHDSTVDRTTNGKGQVGTLTLDQLKELDAGYHWSADGGSTFPFRGRGITVPTLEEVLKNFPDQRLVIEIKRRDPSLATSLCHALNELEKTDQVLVASFSDATIKTFRAACPDVATSVAYLEALWFFCLHWLYLDAAFQSDAQALLVPEHFGPLRLVDQRFVRTAGNHNMAVHVWTVNETSAMRRLLGLGVNGLITDHPERLLRLLQDGHAKIEK